MSEPFQDLEPDEKKFLSEFEGMPHVDKHKRMDCPSPQLLIASQSDALPADVLVKVKTHLEVCALCQMLLRDFGELDTGHLTPDDVTRIRNRIHEKTGTLNPRRVPDAHGDLVWRWLTVGAAAAAMAAVFLVVVHNRWNRADTRIEPRAPGATAKTNEPSVFVLQKAPVKVSASAVLVWRGQAKHSEDEFAANFQKAIEPYRSDDYEEAARRLAALAKKYPGAGAAYFYLGVCQLFLDQNGPAVESLQKAQQLARGALQQDATWYLALSYQRSKDVDSARREVQKLCGQGGEYEARACEGLSELSTIEK
jgi:TolA-binding protein